MKTQIKNYFTEINKYLESNTNKNLEKIIQNHLIKILPFYKKDILDNDIKYIHS